LAKGAICVSISAKASSGAKMILAGFIQTVILLDGCGKDNIRRTFVKWNRM
jgi:hypothetical protein